MSTKFAWDPHRTSLGKEIVSRSAVEVKRWEQRNEKVLWVGESIIKNEWEAQFIENELNWKINEGTSPSSR